MKKRETGKQKAIRVVQAIDGEVRWAAKRARALRQSDQNPDFYEGRRTGLTICRQLLMEEFSISIAELEESRQ